MKNAEKLENIGTKINKLENTRDEILQINFDNDAAIHKIDRKLDKLYRKEWELLKE